MGVVNYLTVNGEIVSETRDGAERDSLPDRLGSTAALIDSSWITDTFPYWPYGELRSRAGSTPTPFKYVGTLGYYADADRLYVRARYLQSQYARWLTVDPLWPREKAFGYVDDSPVSLQDASGFGPILTCESQCSMASAQQMVEAAFAVGGIAAARVAVQRVMCACPYLAAAIGGWYVGRYLDSTFHISDSILNCLFPSESGVEPGTLRDPKACSKDELARRQGLVDAACKDKNGKGRSFGCDRYPKGSNRW